MTGGGRIWTVGQPELKRLLADLRPVRPVTARVLVTLDGQIECAVADVEPGGVVMRGAGPISDGPEDAATITVGYKRLRDAVWALSGDVVLAPAAGGGLRVSGAAVTMTVPAEPEPEPATFAIPALQDPVTVEASDLWRAVAGVAPSADTEASRPVLTGVQFVTRRGTLYAEATDGFRLGVLPVGAVERRVRALVPAAALGGLARLTGLVRLGAAGGRLVAETESLRWAAPLLTGKYPSLPMVLRHYRGEPAATATADAAPLAAAVKQALRFADDLERVELAFGPNGPGLTVRAVQDQDDGDFEAAVPAVVTGGDRAVELNGDYVADAITGLGAERVSVTVTTGTALVLFRSDRTGAVFAVMPMVRRGNER